MERTRQSGAGPLTDYRYPNVIRGNQIYIYNLTPVESRLEYRSRRGGIVIVLSTYALE